METLVIWTLLSLSVFANTRAFKPEALRESSMKKIGKGWSKDISSTVIKSLKTRSQLACSAECLADEDCGAVDYNKDDRTCVIHDKCVDEADAVPSGNGARNILKKSEGSTLIFRAQSGSGDVLYDIWDTSSAYSCPATFKSRVIDGCWSKIKSLQVRMVNGGRTVTFLDFDATGTDKTTWFTKGKLVESSYNDLASTPSNYFSIIGVFAVKRRFYVNNAHAGCSGDRTWLMVLDGDPGGWCDWEQKPAVAAIPWFLYCPGPTACLAKDALPAEEFFIIAQF